MRKIGYARVSASTQNLDRQMGALRAERCHEVYREKASGKAVKGRLRNGRALAGIESSTYFKRWGGRNSHNSVAVCETNRHRGCATHE